MTRRTQWLLAGAIAAVLAGGAAAGSYAMREEIFPVTVGSRAPDFEAVTIDRARQVRSVEDYAGDVVLLNIWATWCGPCRIEMPEIQALYSDFGPRGLRVVAVSIDRAEALEEIRGFVRDYGLTFEVLHNASGDIQRRYQTAGVPETFVIGRDGVIRKRVIGAIHWNSEPNRALVQSLLAEQRES